MALMHIDNIQIKNRIRRLNRDKVKELIESIRNLGLINPITIQDDGTLVAGYHRLEACRQLAQEDEGFAIVPVAYFDHDDKSIQAEIAENLFRHDLSILERAEHLVLYLQQWEQELPAQAQAEMLGMSRKTLFNYRRIVRDIPPEHRQTLKEKHPELCASTRQLLEFAQHEPSAQKALLQDALPLKKTPAKNTKKKHQLSISTELHQELQHNAQRYGLSQKQFTQQLLQAGLQALSAGKLELKDLS